MLTNSEVTNASSIGCWVNSTSHKLIMINKSELTVVAEESGSTSQCGGQLHKLEGGARGPDCLAINNIIN